jgi:hypothetical protein
MEYLEYAVGHWQPLAIAFPPLRGAPFPRCTSLLVARCSLQLQLQLQLQCVAVTTAAVEIAVRCALCVVRCALWLLSQWLQLLATDNTS